MRGSELSGPGMAESVPLVGVKGWLLVLCLWLGLIGPLWGIALFWFLIGRMEEVYPEEAQLFQGSDLYTFIWTTIALREVIHIGTAALLYLRRRASTVWIAICLIWLAGPLLILGSAVLYQPSEVNIPGLARSGAAAVGWTLYLLLSQRVRNTYGLRLGG